MNHFNNSAMSNRPLNRTARNAGSLRGCRLARARLALTLGVSIMKTQLSNQQIITINAVHHAMLICYAA